MVDSTSDPIQRIALIMAGIFNPHEVWILDKPFNPVQGEYISVSTELPSGKYHFDIEQIWHHPPITSYQLVGPNFKIHVPNGLDVTGGIKPGLNHMEFSFPSAIVQFEAKNGNVIKFAPPPFRLENIIFGKKNGSVGGDWWIEDSSGMRFECKITIPFKIKGELKAADGSVIDTAEGDMMKGVYFKKSKKLFVKAVETHLPVQLNYDQKVLDDPFFSENMWGLVFKYMRLSPPDFDSADKEKGVVEQKQRDDMKARNNQYTSRFGFQCKYMHENQ
jgi:hypothetical protein